jgi:hypothetical protein
MRSHVSDAWSDLSPNSLIATVQTVRIAIAGHHAQPYITSVRFIITLVAVGGTEIGKLEPTIERGACFVPVEWI